VAPSTRRTARPRQCHQEAAPLGDDTADLACQRRDHRVRQTCPRLAVPSCVRAARIEPPNHPFDHGVVDHLLATAVCRQRLGEEHRQGLRRRKQPLAVIRQQRLDPVKPLRTGQQIEHRTGVRVARMTAYTLLLPCRRAVARMHGGWLLGWLLRIRNLQPTIRASQPPRFSRLIRHLGLSQCHSGQRCITG